MANVREKACYIGVIVIWMALTLIELLFVIVTIDHFNTEVKLSMPVYVDTTDEGLTEVVQEIDSHIAENESSANHYSHVDQFEIVTRERKLFILISFVFAAYKLITGAIIIALRKRVFVNKLAILIIILDCIIIRLMMSV